MPWSLGGSVLGCGAHSCPVVLVASLHPCFPGSRPPGKAACCGPGLAPLSGPLGGQLRLTSRPCRHPRVGGGWEAPRGLLALPGCAGSRPGPLVKEPLHPQRQLGRRRPLSQTRSGRGWGCAKPAGHVLRPLGVTHRVIGLRTEKFLKNLFFTRTVVGGVTGPPRHQV